MNAEEIELDGFRCFSDEGDRGIIREGYAPEDFIRSVEAASQQWSDDEEGRGALHTVHELAGGSRWFVKQYHHGGIFSEPGDCFYSTPDRFYREARASEQARRGGINVPRPIGVLARKKQPGWLGFYVSEYVPGAPLSRAIRLQQTKGKLKEAGSILARIHALGLDPHDFHIHNLRLDPNDELVVADFDPVGFSEPSGWKRGLRIHRFARSLRKNGFLQEDVDRFRTGYQSVTASGTISDSLQSPLFALKNCVSDLRYTWQGKRPWRPEDREKVLVRVPNWLGDNIMSLPFLQLLAEEPQTGQLDVAVREGLTDLYRSVPAVNHIWGLPSEKSLSLPEKIREQRYSLAITIPKSLRTGIQLCRSGIPRRLGFGTQGRGWCLTDRVSLDGRDRSIHHARLYLELLEDMIARPDQLPDPRLPISEAEIEAVRTEFSLPDDYLVIHPGTAYGPAKRWPPEFFSEFLNYFIEQVKMPVVAVGVPDEQSIADEILDELPDEQSIDLIGETGLSECMAVLKGAPAAVANDSGIMHLSAALGTPTVGIFGSSSPELTSPLGPNARVLYENVDCSPCFETTCPLEEDRYRCLTEISPETVLQTIQGLIA